MESSKEITLDYDIEYSTFKRSYTYRRLAFYVANTVNVVSAYMRKSATGNTHVKLVLHEPVEFYRRIEIRAYLREDAYRIVNDLSRHYLKQHTDVIFDSKLISEEWQINQIGRLLTENLTVNREIAKIKAMSVGEHRAGEWVQFK